MLFLCISWLLKAYLYATFKINHFMKQRLIILAVSLVAFSFLIQSCGDDDEPIKNVLITSHSGTGQFYSIDVTTGETTPIFEIAQDGITLEDLRAFVYHPKEDKYYVSQAAKIGGHLFSVDISTKEATLINDNNGEVVWDAVVNWAVDRDDSLISVGDFNSDGNGFVKFGTDGGRSGRTVELSDACCGFGMLYNAQAGRVTIGNSGDSNDGEIVIENYTKQGVRQGGPILTTFVDFPEDADMETNWLNTKCLAQDGDGPIFGIIYNYGTDYTYFVRIDVDDLTVTYLATLGENKNTLYNLLAFVPENKL